jgi:hypothetical protein
LLLRLLAPIVWPLFLQSRFDSAKMRCSNNQLRKTARRLFKPDLQLRRLDENADLRLVELVRLLARRAARQVFEEQMKGRPTPRP